MTEIFDITPEIFDALGVYIYRYQRHILGNQSQETVMAVIWQLAHANYLANQYAYPTEPERWIKLEHYQFSLVKALAKEVTIHNPHYNRPQALEAIDLIEDSFGSLLPDEIDKLLSSLYDAIELPLEPRQAMKSLFI